MFALFLLMLAAPAFASITFVPGGYATTEASSNGISPLSVGSGYFDHGAQGSGRMQQLFAASEFTQGQALSITQFAFRDDSEDTNLAFDATLQNIQVFMDTTPQTIGGISATFANNTNSEQLVYSGPITFHIPADNNTPRCFCYTFPFSTPYVYIPANGNLLIDIKIILGNDPNNSSLPTLDFARGDTSVMGIAVDYSSSSDASGVAAGNYGWPTQFTFDIVSPEPGSWVLALSGLAAILIIRHRRVRAAVTASRF